MHAPFSSDRAYVEMFDIELPAMPYCGGGHLGVAAGVERVLSRRVHTARHRQGRLVPHAEDIASPGCGVCDPRDPSADRRPESNGSGLRNPISGRVATLAALLLAFRTLGRLTFVARPPASSSTMAYQPKSICHSFQPRRADHGFA